MQNQILYYYANSAELNYIQNASSILPTNYFIGSICWLTFNSQWEKYVSNVSDNGGEYIAGIDFERVAVKDTLFRIQIDPHVAAHDFRDICINNHRSVKRAVKYLASIDIYNPNQWRFSFKPIPSIHWLGIDYWNNSISQWRPCPDFDPSESMIYLKDYQEVLNNLTVKMTRLESERDKAKAEVLDIKALADSKNIRIASLESSNGKLQQEVEEAKKQLRYFLDTHTESALEQKNKQIEEEKESESFEKELIEEALEKANATIVEKDKAIDSQENYVQYLQARLRAKGIPYNPHHGHQQNKKAA